MAETLAETAVCAVTAGAVAAAVGAASVAGAASSFFPQAASAHPSASTTDTCFTADSRLYCRSLLATIID
ncbi:hypothetical protein [Lysobacter antibioticus]|uniref:hypothetical protein n=1 Tax=Lysobacter antibioticus TaxID=84531 RepID=UPI00114076C0|nr:hypothetical protein [Lysobacter antibioticus]